MPPLKFTYHAHDSAADEPYEPVERSALVECVGERCVAALEALLADFVGLDAVTVHYPGCDLRVAKLTR